jgi:hypothetical protein
LWITEFAVVHFHAVVEIECAIASICSKPCMRIGGIESKT